MASAIQKPLDIWLSSVLVSNLFLIIIWPQDSSFPFSLQGVQCSCGHEDDSRCSGGDRKDLSLQRSSPQFHSHLVKVKHPQIQV